MIYFKTLYLLSTEWIFSDWDSIWRTLLIGVSAYLALVALLRISGKRTLSKLNAFDLVITVAFGSTLASALTSQRVSLAQCVTAFIVLILLQFIFTWLAVRFDNFQNIIKASPTMIFYKGNFLHDIMKKERVTEEELRAVVREHGHASMQNVAAIVMETDGSFSVIKNIKEGEYGSLRTLDKRFSVIQQDYQAPLDSHK
ncbi:MAG: DUF421 domain-containing protein [Saprospiraceae bacterium]